jgi:hypothetical protein
MIDSVKEFLTDFPDKVDGIAALQAEIDSKIKELQDRMFVLNCK